MKKQKLKLENLKVESFITDLNEKNKQTIAGGNDVLNGAGAAVLVASAAAGGLPCAVAGGVLGVLSIADWIFSSMEVDTQANGDCNGHRTQWIPPHSGCQ